MLLSIKNICFFSLFCVYIFGKPQISPINDEYIIGNLLGGSGNCFFQIAAVEALARDHGANAYFPGLALIPSGYQHYFSRCNIFPPNGEITEEWVESTPKYSSIPYRSGMRISGYLQSYRYFDKYKEDLQVLFAPTKRDLRYIQKKYGDLLSSEKTVGIQLRYYVEDPYTYSQYGRDFLEKAMQFFPEDSLFIVSSNKVSFAKQEMPRNRGRVIFLEAEPDYIDFYILTLCKNIIISNSTFGWWSAYLNQNPTKTIVCPKEWNALGIPDIPMEWVTVEAERIPAEQVH